MSGKYRGICVLFNTVFLGVVLAGAWEAIGEETIMSAKRVVDVTEYGATPDDGKDDTQAIIDAIEALHALDDLEPGQTRMLHFSEGDYHISEGVHPEHPRQPFRFLELENLEIDGGGARLLFSGVVAPFIFYRCETVTVKDLTIDWVRPPYSAGEIINTGDKYFDVAVFDRYPVEGGEPVVAFQDFDPETRLPLRDVGRDVYYSVPETELIAPQTLRVHTNFDTGIESGYWAVLRHQVYSYNAFMFSRCQDVHVHDVTVHSTPGMGLVADTTHNITLERFHVAPTPGEERLVSATADGTHFSGCTGLIRIDDCRFDRMGDDAVNIKTGLYLIIEEIVDERTVIGHHPLGFQILPDPGDVMELSPTDTLLSYAEAVVASSHREEDLRSRVVFEEPLPETLAEGHVLGNVSRVARAHISNTHVTNNRARGFLIQTRDALVEDCSFEKTTTSGIFVMTEVVHFYESIAPHDIVVRNNTFKNCGYTNPQAEGVIQVYAYLKDFAFPPEPGVIRNITIENNRIQGANNAGIFVTSTDGIKIMDNVIEDVCRRPHRPEANSAIYVMSTRNAEIRGNTARLEDQGAGCEAVFTLGPGNEEDSFVISDNTGF